MGPRMGGSLGYLTPAEAQGRRGTAWCSAARPSAARHGAARHGTAWCSAARPSAARLGPRTPLPLCEFPPWPTRGSTPASFRSSPLPPPRPSSSAPGGQGHLLPGWHRQHFHLDHSGGLGRGAWPRLPLGLCSVRIGDCARPSRGEREMAWVSVGPWHEVSIPDSHRSQPRPPPRLPDSPPRAESGDAGAAAPAHGWLEHRLQVWVPAPTRRGAGPRAGDKHGGHALGAQRHRPGGRGPGGGGEAQGPRSGGAAGLCRMQ